MPHFTWALTLFVSLATISGVSLDAGNKRPGYPIFVGQRATCTERLVQGIFLSCQTIRRANPDSLFAAMGHLGLRIELEDSSQRIEPFIDQYLASHQRYLLALRRTHLSNSPVAKLIDHMLLTLETGVPTAQTKMARTFLQLFYPSIPLRGQYRENREPQSSFDRYSPLHQLHLHFEGFDLAEHNRSAVFIEALMTDAQLDDLLSGKKPDSGRAANWLRVKLKLP